MRLFTFSDILLERQRNRLVIRVWPTKAIRRARRHRIYARESHRLDVCYSARDRLIVSDVDDARVSMQ